MHWLTVLWPLFTSGCYGVLKCRKTGLMWHVKLILALDLIGKSHFNDMLTAVFQYGSKQLIYISKIYLISVEYIRISRELSCIDMLPNYGHVIEYRYCVCSDCCSLFRSRSTFHIYYNGIIYFFYKGYWLSDYF